MVTTDRAFAIPCPCGARVTVSAGQAGGRAACAACGGSLDVPRLRDLAGFTAADAGDRVRTATGWDLPRGMTFAGCAVAALAALAAVVAEPLGGALIGRPPSPGTIRRDVAAAPIAAVHAAFSEASRAGVNRPPSPAEVRLQQFSRLARGLSLGLWVVAGVGGVIACAGLAVRSAPRPAADDAP